MANVRPEPTSAHEGVPLTPLIKLSHQNPYPAYEKLRAKGPVYYSSTAGVFLVSSLKEGHQALKDPKLGRGELMASMLGMSAHRERAVEGYRSTLLFTDPPDHGRMRAFMSRAFQPRVLEGLRASIEGIVDKVLDKIARKKRVDLVATLSQRMPVEVIAKLIGVPEEDWDKCVAWSADLAPTIDAVVSKEVLERAVATGFVFADYFRALVAKRRSSPEDDILTALIRGVDEEKTLTEDELVSNVMTLFTAGHETTTNLISNTFVLLSQHPEARALFEADPGARLEGLVEESLRYEAPVQLSARMAREGTEIGGVPIPPKSAVWVLIGAANRDPARFPEPARFDITRDPNPHLSFGSGIHFCLGAPLARMEAQIALSRFFARYPRWRLSDEALELRRTTTLRGYVRVEVALKGR